MTVYMAGREGERSAWCLWGVAVEGGIIENEATRRSAILVIVFLLFPILILHPHLPCPKKMCAFRDFIVITGKL